MEKRDIETGKGQEHLEAVLSNIETVNDLDVSFLLTQMSSFEFRDAMKSMTRKYKEQTGKDLKVEMFFYIDDPEIEKHYPDKQKFLRFLKAILENNFYRKHITGITVKGPKNTPNIEPNVFSSGVRFEQIDDE